MAYKLSSQYAKKNPKQYYTQNTDKKSYIIEVIETQANFKRPNPFL